MIVILTISITLDIFVNGSTVVLLSYLNTSSIIIYGGFTIKFENGFASIK